MDSIGESPSRRGCLYFNFGTAYALRLLVSVHSLRRHYAGPVTVFLGQDDSSAALGKDLETLGVEVRMLGALSKSWDRHRLFLESPYRTTLVLDSDTLVRAPIDELWLPLEREGLLVTRFHAPPHGVDGTAENPQWGDRMMLLRGMRGLVDEAVYAAAERRLLDERIDINVGVMGVSRPLGDRFLEAWAGVMERGRTRKVPLLDEMSVVAILPQHRHHLADERWNCPADEFFRSTNLEAAGVIHYFADGARVGGTRLGRNPASWAGRKWYAGYREAAGAIDLARWRRLDPSFAGPLEQYLAAAPLHRIYHPVQTFGRVGRRLRKRIGCR